MIFNNFSDPGEWTVLGLMSGTSLDGLDAARVRFVRAEGRLQSWELLDFRTRRMPPALRDRLEALVRGGKLDALGLVSGGSPIAGTYGRQIAMATGRPSASKARSKVAGEILRGLSDIRSGFSQLSLPLQGVEFWGTGLPCLS